MAKQRHTPRGRSSGGGRSGPRPAAASSSQKPVVRIVAALSVFGLLVGLVAAIVAGTAADGGDTDAADRRTPADLRLPAPGATITGDTPCPEVDGSSERTTSFEAPASGCIEPGVAYTATITTDRGDIVVALDPGAAPEAVEEFVSLARYHYWDGIPFTGVFADGLLISASASPDGSIGPGYELPVDPPDDPTYERGDLVLLMSADGTTTAGFAIVTTDAMGLELGPNHFVLGRAVEGEAVFDNIVEVAGSDLGTPLAEVVVRSVVITQSDPDGA